MWGKPRINLYVYVVTVMLTCHEITSQTQLLRQTWLLYLVRRG